jgi:hypothetical protein
MGGNTACAANASDTVFHFFPHCFDVRRELGIGEALGKQIERFENRQPGANQRDELLVKDQEFFEIDLLAPAHRNTRDGMPRLDGIDQETLLLVALPEVLFRRGFGYLLVDFAARVGIFQYELRH